MHKVEITKVNRGFIVEIGCQKFVFENYDSMTSGIKEYFDDPKKAEEKFVEKEFKRQTVGAEFNAPIINRLFPR